MEPKTPIERFRQRRADMVKDCPECGSSHTNWNVPEKGALGFYCEECDWSMDPYTDI